MNAANQSEIITSVPYSTIHRYEPGFMESWLKEVKEHSLDTRFIGGEYIKRTEIRLAELAGTARAVTCANGTDAIQLALRAIGVGHGDRVIMPDSTFWATFEAICNVGARPICVDIDHADLHISTEILETALKAYQPKAVVLVHLYGWAAKDTLNIRELCKRYKVPLLEDSAQAWGVTINDSSIFSDAYISTVSFFPGKVLGCAGDGGAVFTNDKNLAENVRLLANHGRQGKYEHHLVGWNSRFDVLQAAFLNIALDYIPQRLASRRYAAQWYHNNIQVNGLKFMSPAPGIKENGYISVGLTSSPIVRTKLEKALKAANVGYGIVYPSPISEQPGANDWIGDTLTYGTTKKVCETIINLPCFAGITESELNYVKDTIIRCLNEE